MARATAITSANAMAPATARPSIQSAMRTTHRNHAGCWEEVGDDRESADLDGTGGGISLRMEKSAHYKNEAEHLLRVEKRKHQNTCFEAVLARLGLGKAGSNVCF